MKNKYILLVCVLGFFTKLSASSSIPLPVNIQSPNAASLGSYGQYVVSEYTGVPNISIPLMDLSAGPLKLNVSMSYDASGIRINSHPSWVGQNWALNAGGVITRSIQGYEDEYPNSEEFWRGNHCHKAGFFTTLNKETYRGLNLINTYFDLNQVREYNDYDLTPDKFTFNFMGKHGCFFMSNDGQWKVQSDCNLQVIFYADMGTHDTYKYMKIGPDFSLDSENYMHKNVTINGFRMRDDEGFVYVFGFDENAIEYSIDFFNQKRDWDPDYISSRWRSNAWYLSKVYDRFGNQLFSLDYVRGTYIAEFFEYSENTACYETTIYDFGYSYSSKSEIEIGKGGTNEQWEYNKNLLGNLISPVYLKNIYSFPNNQSLLFISSKSSERPYINFPYYSYSGCKPTGASNYVESVGTAFPIGTITDSYYRCNTGDNIHGVVYPYLQLFSTDYVETEGRNVDRREDPILGLRWWRLDAIHLLSGYSPRASNLKHVESVRITYNDGVANETDRLIPTKVDFEFNNQNYYDYGKTPEYSYSFDYYGNISLVKKYLNKYIDDWGYDGGNTNGVLHRIMYPTGGYTSFSYEQNYADWYVDGLSKKPYSSTVGGLRVNSITNYKGGNEPLKSTKTYEYNNGIVNARPVFEFEWETNDSWILDNTGYQIKKCKTWHRDSSTPILPLSNHSGKFIEYPEIIETISNGQLVDECTTYYQFISYDSISNEAAEHGFNDPSYIFSDRSFARGKLLKKKVTTQSHIEVTEYKYRKKTETFNNNIIWASNYRKPIMVFSNNEVLETETGCLYKIYYGDYDIVEGKVELFKLNDLTNPISKTIKKFNNKDFSKNISYNYPYDQTSPCVNFRLLESEEELTSNGVYIKTVYHYPFNEDDNYSYLSSQVVLGKLCYKYFNLKPISITSLINNAQVFNQEWKYDVFNSHIFPSNYYRSMNSGIFSLPDISYLDYDNYGNLLSYKDKSGMCSSIIWDEMLMKPSVHIRNMSYTTLLGLIGQNGINAFRFRNDNYANRLEYLNTLRAAGKNVSVEYYEYSSMDNLIRRILPNGQGYEYNYDDAHRLSEVNTLNGISLERYDYKYRIDPLYEWSH